MTKEEMAKAYADGFIEKYREIAYDAFLCGFGAKCTTEIPNDLEEAARKEYPCDKSWMTPDMLDLNAHKQVAFRKGDEWQKEQDTRDMYMSDNRHFEKVYQLGRTDMREQMMREAVEGEVVKDISNKLAVTAKINLDGFKFGDKVRIIVIPNTDEK